MEAPKPQNEDQRLTQLREMHILDTPVEERFERITRIVCRSLDVPISAISLVDEERQWFKSIQGLDTAETSRSSSFCAHAILDQEPLIVEDALEDERFADNPLVTGDPNIRFYAGIPLELKDGIRIGSLCAIDRAPRAITEEQVTILKDLAEMVKSELASIKLSSAHIDLIKELAKAERAALIDPLTRLWNRGGGESLLDRELKAARREASSLSVALLDIDHFKGINDTNGHDVGDQILRSVSRKVLSIIRPSDSFCRWGGDEFLLILPNCSSAFLESTLKRVVQEVQSEFEPVSVTVSVGATTLQSAGRSGPIEILKVVDEALYDAKDAGRNGFKIT